MSCSNNSLLCSQQKLKEEKEAKRALIDPRHQHLFSSVATKLSLEDAEVEEFILEGDQVYKRERTNITAPPLTPFRLKRWTLSLLQMVLMVYCSFTRRCRKELLMVSNSSSLSLVLYFQHTGKPTKPLKQLYLTDGTKEPFTGLGLFFLRSSPKGLTTANVAQDTYFGVLESSGGGGLLEAMETLVKNVFVPALKEQSNWGELSKDATGHIVKESFLVKLDGFVSVLANARASIADMAKLSPCSHTGLAAISSPSEAIAAASVPDVVEGAESSALLWCKEIEQVYREREL